MQVQTETTPRILGMRDVFFNALFEIFRRDPRCVIVTADNGAPTLDQFAHELPAQFHTVGIAEQQMVGMCAGIALEGGKAYGYAIAPFVTIRVAEYVKLDMCAMNLDVVMLGVGAGYAYDIMGPSHHTVEDISIMRSMPNLTIWSPCDAPTAEAMAQFTYATRGPQYVRFDRTGLPVADGPPANPVDGMRRVGALDGRIAIIATGVMVHTAVQVQKILSDRGIDASVIDVFRIKPLSTEALASLTGEARKIVVLEEHFRAGGLGSLILEVINDCAVPGLWDRRVSDVLRIGVDDRYTFIYGGREVIWKSYGLDAGSVAERIVKWARA